jgi:hypothetical protein
MGSLCASFHAEHAIAERRAINADCMVVDINQRASANAKYSMQMKCTSCVCALWKAISTLRFSTNEKEKLIQQRRKCW